MNIYNNKIINYWLTAFKVYVIWENSVSFLILSFNSKTIKYYRTKNKILSIIISIAK